MNRKTRRLAGLLSVLLLLTGCASIPIKQDATSTLPPPVLPYEAPVGDSGDSSAETVLLSLPNASSGRLEFFPERILLSHTKHPAEFTIRRLFSYSGTTQAAALPGNGQLALNAGSTIEISGNTATVNLAPGALSLSNQERFLVSRAITNTLTQWGDIHYVNILINSRQAGLDTAATLPLGSLARSEDGDISSQWELISRTPANNAGPYSAMATLYFPMSAGRGIAAEARLITAKDRSLSQMAHALVAALSSAPSSLPNALPLPDLTLLLAQPVAVEEGSGSIGRLVRLHFQEQLNEALIAAGIPRSVLMAALTYTLTTFLPYTAGISVTIGREPVSALVPAGLYEGAGEQILFENGLMQRMHFGRFLLDHCTLFFANAQGSLSATQRPIPHHQAYNPRYLLGQLMAGPQDTDSVVGLSPVLPRGLRDADLLGISRQDDLTLVNFSQNIKTLSQGMGSQQELAMVYAMVNTLTQKGSSRQVCFYVDGTQEGSFVQHIDLAGTFLRNVGMIN